MARALVTLGLQWSHVSEGGHWLRWSRAPLTSPRVTRVTDGAAADLIGAGKAVLRASKQDVLHAGCWVCAVT